MNSVGRLINSDYVNTIWKIFIIISLNVLLASQITYLQLCKNFIIYVHLYFLFLTIFIIIINNLKIIGQFLIKFIIHLVTI